MKKILSVAILTFFSVVVYAQNQESAIVYTTSNGEQVDVNHNLVQSHTFDAGKGEIILKDGISEITGDLWSSGKSNVTSIIIADCITTICKEAFLGFDSLMRITIPDSATKIEKRAFQGCTSLKIVYCKPMIPPTGGSDMFEYIAEGCKIYVPISDDDSIINAYKAKTHWKNYAYLIFEEKPANNEIWYTATEKVEPYDKSVFGATYLSNEWYSEIGRGVITFEGDVTTIGECAFQECSNLTSVTIPDSITTIGDEAFRNCPSLTSVTIPDSVKTIGNYAFASCGGLASVTIGDSVTTIGDLAFYNCRSLTSVTIGNSVTTIGNRAFWFCESLKEFKGKFAADGGRCLIMDNTIIAYAEASGTTYTIPDSVTTIGKWAFYWCSSLTSVTIPDSVTTIEYGAFEGCASLTSVTIPDSVTTIGNRAFSDCYRLKTVYCKPTTPPTGGSSMFSNNAAGRRIFVPASDDGSIINAYKANYHWSNYKNDIFEEK